MNQATLRQIGGRLVDKWQNRFAMLMEESILTTIASLLRPEDILLDMDVSSKGQLFSEIGLLMERDHGMRQAWVAASLSRREKVGSTGLGEGFAIPHARVKDLDRIQVAYVRLKQPIPFGSPDGNPVFELLVILVPKQAAEEHLRILADTTRMFSNRSFREQLQRCSSPQEVKRLFDAWSLASC